MSLSRYAVEQNINPVLIMSSYVVTHIKNANPAGGDEWRNACGNLEMFTLHIALRMFEMLSATSSSLVIIISFLNGSVTTNAKKNYNTNSIQIRTDRPTDRQERCVAHKLTTFFHRAIHSLLESETLQLGEQQKKFFFVPRRQIN